MSRIIDYMTQISNEDVLRLAQLSSLELEEGEIETLRTHLEGVINHVDELAELDTEGVEPTYQVTDLQNVSRDDTVIDYGVSREQLLACAPDQQDNSVKVPKVL